MKESGDRPTSDPIAGEPDVGSNIRALTTRAAKVPGGYRIRGSKLYITNAPIADFITLAARTRPETDAGAISLFLVELPDPAVQISKLEKEGIRASETGLIHLEDLFVPDTCLLGGREGTYPIILESLSENRVGVAANCLGMARGALEVALDFARTRVVGDRTIGRYQAIAHKLADMAAEIEAAKGRANLLVATALVERRDHLARTLHHLLLGGRREALALRLGIARHRDRLPVRVDHGIEAARHLRAIVAMGDDDVDDLSEQRDPAACLVRRDLGRR